MLIHVPEHQFEHVHDLRRRRHHVTLAVPNVGQVGPYGYLECVNCSPALSALAPGLLALVRRKA
jgi:hypothetical protein